MSEFGNVAFDPETLIFAICGAKWPLVLKGCSANTAAKILLFDDSRLHGVPSGVSLRYSRSPVIEILGASDYEFAIGNRVGEIATRSKFSVPGRQLRRPIWEGRHGMV
jgi:hypothetical protein